MAREEQIQKAAIEDCGYYANNRGYHSFVAGVKWADEHPKSPWISVEERLPEYNRKCFAINKFSGETYSAYYLECAEEWIETYLGDEIHGITHWFYKPKFEEE